MTDAMFPFLPPPARTSTPPPPRPTTPISHTPPPPVAPILASLYTSLLRPTLLPPPVAFTQPLLDSFVEHHDPLLEDDTIFTIAGRLREVGVEVERIAREWGRRGETTTGGGADEMLVDIRKAKLRCRLQNQGGTRDQRTQVKMRERERIQAFEKEMQREDEEALRSFKEGLRRAVGAG